MLGKAILQLLNFLFLYNILGKNDQTKSGTQKANADEPIRYPQTGDGWSGWGKDKTGAAGAGPVWDVVQAGYGGGGGQDDTQTVSTAGLSSGTMRGTIAGAIGKNRLTSVLARLPGAGGGSQADGGVRDVLWGLDEYNNPRPPTPQPTTTTTTNPRPTTTTSTTPAPTTTRLSTLANNFGDPLDFFVNEFDRIEESVRTQQQEETNGNDVMRNAGRSLQNLNSKFNSLFNINIPPTQNTVLDQRSQLFNNRPTAKSLPINDPNAIINLDPSSKEFMIMREFYKKKKHQYDKSQEELLSLGRPSVPPERALSNFQGSFQVEKILSNRNNGNNLLNSGLMQPSTQANSGMLQANSNNILKNVLLQSQQQQQQANSNILDNNGMLTNQQNLFNLQSISQSFKRKNPVVSNPFSGLLPKSQPGLSSGGGLVEDQVHQQLPLFTPNQQLNSPSQHLPQTLPEHSLSNLAQTFNYGQQPNGLASLPQPNIGQHNMGQPNMGQQPNFKPGLNGNFQPPPSQNMGPAQDTENRLLTLLSHPHQLSMSSKAELDHMLRTATLPQLVEVQRLIQAQEQQRQGGARQGADIQNTVNNVINSRMNSVGRNPQMFYKEGPSPSPNNQIQLKGNYDAIQTGGEMYHQQRSPQIHPMSGGPAEMPFNHQPAAPQAPPPPPVPDFSPYSRELNSYDDAYYDNSQYDNEYELAKITTHQEYDCRRKNDGVYGGGCRAFYRCEAGDTYRVECKGDYVQNRRTGHCDTAKNSPPPCGEWKDCSGRGNGKYADVDAQCLTYYTCHEGVFLGHNECNPGTVFDEKEQVCNWPDSVLPPCGRGGKRKTRRLLVKRKRKVE